MSTITRRLSATALIIGLLVPVLYLLGATSLGSVLNDSVWLSVLASGLPIGLIGGVVAVAMLLAFVFHRNPKWLESIGESSSRLTGTSILFGILVFFAAGVRSTLFGSGNLLVGQIRQLPHLPVGLTWQVDQILILLSRVLVACGLRDDQSAFWAVHVFSALCAMIAVPALTGILSRTLKGNTERLSSLCIVLIPILPFFAGLISREAVLLPIVAWTISLATLKRRTILQSLQIVLIVLIGCWLHPWAIMLLPLAVVGLLPLTRMARVMVGLILLAVVIVWLYYVKDQSIGLFMSLQSVRPPAALDGEWLLAPDHLLACGMIMLTALPFLSFWLLPSGERDDSSNTTPMLLVVSCSGLAAMLFIRLPQTIILDWPRLLPLLLPAALMLALHAGRYISETHSSRWRRVIVPSVLGLSLIWVFPLSQTGYGEDYATRLADLSEQRWVAVGLGLRDGYFLEKKYDEATYWENQLRTRSSDYLTWHGCYDLIGSGEYAAAISELNQVLITQPFWADPRSMLALANARTNSFPTARAQMDTVLAQFPYDQQLLISRYSIELQASQVVLADSMILAVRRLYPEQMTVMTDQMIAAGRLGRIGEAVARADSLLIRNPKYAPAMRVHGMAAEHDGRIAEAINWYQKYLEAETDMTQITAMRSKISQLSGSLPDSTAPKH